MKFTKENVEKVIDEYFWQADLEPCGDLIAEIHNLDDTPEKVVVPKFVADWYESQTPISGNDVFRIIQDVIKLSNEEHTWGDYDIDVDIMHYVKNNEEAFLHLLVNCKHKEGYEVEKEPLYYIPLPHLETSDGIQQVLSQRENSMNYFASRPNEKIKQRYTKEELAQVPEIYKSYATLIDENAND